jgi:hypothetical protein
MGVKASDDLFQLIRSLTAAEKRAFRLLSERHTRQDGNNYLLLFDAIAAQETYDEAALRQAFAGKAFLNNLSEAKAYLYRTLLRSLRFTRGPESPETELREMLDHLEILHAKGLGEQAERQVRIGLEKARALDLHALAAEFHRWQRRLAKWRGGKGMLAELAAIGEGETTALRHLGIEAHLRDLVGRIQIIFSKQVDGRDPAQAAELEVLWADPWLREPPLESGFHALSSYYLAHAFYHRSQVSPLKAMEAWQSLVATFRAYPAQIRHQRDQYINALASLLDARLNIGTLQLFHEDLEELRNQKSKEPSITARIFFLDHHLSLRFALATGELDKALRQAPNLEIGMAKYHKYLSPSLELTFLNNLCSLYFLAERYPEAQRYINLVLNRPHLPLREDILDALRLLEMIARYARGQQDVLEHLYKAHERRLRQLLVKPAFAVMAFKFIGQLLHAVDAQETRACIQEMAARLEELGPKIPPAGYLEISLWVRSRMGNRSMAEILREEG